MAAIPALVLRLARESGMRVTVGCSTFVPKPGTPYARQPMVPPDEAARKLDAIRTALRGRADFTAESPRWSFWQGVLARGGRELAPVLATLDPRAKPAQWEHAFRDAGFDAALLALQEIASDAPVPWGHIGVERCAFGDERPAAE
jgi:hypothetical protein